MDLHRLAGMLMVVLVLVIELDMPILSRANLVFNVQHKFAGRERSLSAFKAHDAQRHRRILYAAQLPLGGNGHPAEASLYFTKIGLGNPSNDYHVQVDTGSDILWVNCVGCDKCPDKSDLGIKLRLYDPKSSSSSSSVNCGDEFCTSTYNGVIPGCNKTIPCQYNVVYGDGSSTAGYFVKDTLHFDRPTGDLQTSSTNGTIIFGCGAVQSGGLGSSNDAVDGILGLGQSNSSMISQLASAGKVKRVFSHCLDSVNGGGIFAIGELVSPKLNTTPMLPNKAHYNVVLKDIEVGGSILEIPTSIFDLGKQKEAIIDSGTTLAYLPEVVYETMMNKITEHQPGLKLHTVEERFTCFRYDGKVDDGFPVVKFHFAESLTLSVYPREYLFKIRDELWCFGWQNSAMQSKDGRDMTLLGDLVLSNKIFMYDIEKQAIGWTEYDCSSSIKVKDETTGSVYSVKGGEISPASHLMSGKGLPILLLLLAMFQRLI
ncbi:hypothetical protein K2173_011839 [Erythroxylum novogranatense]|uniref:Peptidase A1 domain-containing protein n=1 Tax=Erythroxylum novogranatense TaxID=1862640 RepID=A0AAV8SLC6_9ROSI|nr:hypothetical protein K2173_011839 [Erythroxylum novogranatense]